jgi:TIR domain-containing protein
MADVFLSYAREDRPAALALARALEGRGWSVWWDREIHPGEAFDQAIERELAAAGAVVVLWSERSVGSEWVKNEAAEAAERGVLVPALLDTAKLPLEFRRRQAADLAGWRGNPEHDGFRALCAGVAAKVSTPARRAPVTPRAAPGRLTSAIATVLVLAFLGAALARWWHSPGRTSSPGTATTAGTRADLADVVTGTYFGNVVADAKGPSQSDVTVTVTKLGPRRVRVSADYDRLRTADVDVTRAGDRIVNAAGSTTLILDGQRLEYNPDSEVSYVGTRRP